MLKFLVPLSLVAASVAAPVFAEQLDVKATIVNKLKTSRDFTIKMAEAMPAADYSFKLTPPQMSFGEQIVHLAEALSYLGAVLTGQKPEMNKPDPNNKEAVISFVKSQYGKAIDEVSKLTPEQLSKTYKSEEGTATGLELLLGMLDHSTHHRASAEMYLRAKGIKPPEYQM